MKSRLSRSMASLYRTNARSEFGYTLRTLQKKLNAYAETQHAN